ncbi:MAG: hypothetical protein ACKO2N_11960, partial [Tabrizicola sp.]
MGDRITTPAETSRCTATQRPTIGTPFRLADFFSALLKEMLLAAEPATYFDTDHYKGYPAVLVRPGLL